MMNSGYGQHILWSPGVRTNEILLLLRWVLFRRYCPFMKNSGCSFAFDVFSFSIKLFTFLIYITISLTLLKYNLKDQIF